MIGEKLQRSEIGSNKVLDINAIALNSSTATSIVSANNERIFFSVSNSTSQDIWLQFEKEGTGFENAIFMPKQSYWEMPSNLYFGEIKAISVSGTPTVTILEY